MLQAMFRKKVKDTAAINSMDLDALLKLHMLLHSRLGKAVSYYECQLASQKASWHKQLCCME